MRYVDSLNLKNGIECFILIEPGQGFLVPALREKFKNSKIIALHVNDDFPSAGVSQLCGTDPANVQNFLEKEVPETEAANIKIIEWRPSLNFYGEAYLKLLSNVVEFIKRRDAASRTVSAFGRRWVKNFFRNLGNVKEVLLYKTADTPVIITGSGPSLEEALPVIRGAQDGAIILAASSSVTALANGGVTADIVITTDGGAWALKHLYSCHRNSKAGTAIAANLCAALPSQCAASPLLIINDGSLWQSITLHELAIPSVIIPQMGTVTASAVELAMILSGGNVYLAGLDLSVKDIRTHARPYGFDHLIYEQACRIKPSYSQTFVRSGLIQGGGGLNIYKAWFKNQLASWPKRIFSVDSAEVFEYSLPPQTPAGKKNTGDYFKAVRVDNGGFREKGRAALLSALKDSRYSENLKAELVPLLLPGKKDATERELEEAIFE